MMGRAATAAAVAGLLLGTTAFTGPAMAQAPRPAAQAASQASSPLPRVRPEEVGMSSERLARIADVLKAEIERNRTPGGVLAIARRGKLVHLEAYGLRDKAAGAPMTTDAIFNIASMTKPVVAVAALMLVQEGKLLIDDPVSKHLPQFAEMKVAARDEAGQPTAETVPAARPITIQDLMRHTSGLVYGSRGNTAIHKQYPDGSQAAAETLTGQEFLDKLSKNTLLYQPGSTWDYGFGLDVLGLVVEKVSGKPLDAFLQERLFGPLGMTDTGFLIPEGKAGRYARALPADPITGRPQAITPDLTKPLRFACGGGCLASTAADYLHFTTFLREQGRGGGRRLLGRKLVEYMLSDQLPPGTRNLIAGTDPTRADHTFGLGLALRTTPGIARMLGSMGSYGWPGSTGTDWWVDPKEELEVVYLTHSPGPIRWHYRQLVNALVYGAIED